MGINKFKISSFDGSNIISSEKVLSRLSSIFDLIGNKDSNITLAIKMANEGKSIAEISSATGMSSDEIEPIMKYHGK